MRLLLGTFLWKYSIIKLHHLIGVLKNDITSLIRPEAKSVFKIHDPAGLRYLFQLRVSFASFKRSQMVSQLH